MQHCERTFVGDETIDYSRALQQHAAYEDALRAHGAEITTLDVNLALPDCVFVEDTAVVLDEVAIIMSMGAVSRRTEPAGIEPALRAHRPLTRVVLPGTIDGGDVVRSGRSLYVGHSSRTNTAGIRAFRDIVRPYGYSVTAIPVHGCLHLKTACSSLPDGRFLVNARLIDASLLKSDILEVPTDEPWAGDVLVIGDRIIASNAFSGSIDLLRSNGFGVTPVAVSEFAKAEGGVTCLSLVFAS
jgi:dimethylargininase